MTNLRLKNKISLSSSPIYLQLRSSKKSPYTPLKLFRWFSPLSKPVARARMPAVSWISPSGRFRKTPSVSARESVAKRDSWGVVVRYVPPESVPHAKPVRSVHIPGVIKVSAMFSYRNIFANCFRSSKVLCAFFGCWFLHPHCCCLTSAVRDLSVVIKSISPSCL